MGAGKMTARQARTIRYVLFQRARECRQQRDTPFITPEALKFWQGQLEDAEDALRLVGVE